MKAVLSTANWGEALDRGEAMAILEAFQKAGGSYISAASHYPVSSVPERCGRANDYLQYWLQKNPDSKPKVICQIGYLDNTETPPVDVSAAAILTKTELVRGRLFDALWAISLAADTRDNAPALRETWRALNDLHVSGLEIGFAGLSHPQAHAKQAPKTIKAPLLHVVLREKSPVEIARYKKVFPQVRVLLDSYGPLNADLKTLLSEAIEAAGSPLFGVAFTATNPQDLTTSLSRLTDQGAELT